jgi:catalase
MAETVAPRPIIAQLVETMRALAGAHPGFRPVHAKGIVCAGTFRGTREARGISRAQHLQGQAVPTIIRFSNAHGDPDVHDGLANPRALAVKFQLPEGQSADILANSIEGFPARTPEDLLAFLRAQLPDPVTGQPVPEALPRFLSSHPAARAFLERLMQKPVPASYGQTSYHGEHAFLFTATDGRRRGGRYHWRPEAAEAYLSPPTRRASGAPTSCARSWRAGYATVRSCSASSCKWPQRAIRRTTSPPCGPRTGPWSNWGS